MTGLDQERLDQLTEVHENWRDPWDYDDRTWLLGVVQQLRDELRRTNEATVKLCDSSADLRAAYRARVAERGEAREPAGDLDALRTDIYAELGIRLNIGDDDDDSRDFKYDLTDALLRLIRPVVTGGEQ